MTDANTNLILASGSQTRLQLLQAAGVQFTVRAPGVDEDAIRKALDADGDGVEPADVAEVLARAKADAISSVNPALTVIGADQVLALDQEIFTKPKTIEAAQATLLKLRGKQHTLHTAVVIMQAGEATFVHVAAAHMTMRDFSPRFLAEYLVRAGDDILDCVGAYQIEGVGLQLFEEIDGDHSTILGLPMLPLLTALRGLGHLDT